MAAKAREVGIPEAEQFKWGPFSGPKLWNWEPLSEHEWGPSNRGIPFMDFGPAKKFFAPWVGEAGVVDWDSETGLQTPFADASEAVLPMPRYVRGGTEAFMGGENLLVSPIGFVPRQAIGMAGRALPRGGVRGLARVSSAPGAPRPFLSEGPPAVGPGALVPEWQMAQDYVDRPMMGYTRDPQAELYRGAFLAQDPERMARMEEYAGPLREPTAGVVEDYGRDWDRYPYDPPDLTDMSDAELARLAEDTGRIEEHAQRKLFQQRGAAESDRLVAGFGLIEFDNMMRANAGMGWVQLKLQKNNGITRVPESVKAEVSERFGSEFAQHDNIDDAMRYLQSYDDLTPDQKADIFVREHPGADTAAAQRRQEAQINIPSPSPAMQSLKEKVAHPDFKLELEARRRADIEQQEGYSEEGYFDPPEAYMTPEEVEADRLLYTDDLLAGTEAAMAQPTMTRGVPTESIKWDRMPTEHILGKSNLSVDELLELGGMSRSQIERGIHPSGDYRTTLDLRLREAHLQRGMEREKASGAFNPSVAHNVTVQRPANMFRRELGQEPMYETRGRERLRRIGELQQPVRRQTPHEPEDIEAIFSRRIERIVSLQQDITMSYVDQHIDLGLPLSSLSNHQDLIARAQDVVGLDLSPTDTFERVVYKITGSVEHQREGLEGTARLAEEIRSITDPEDLPTIDKPRGREVPGNTWQEKADNLPNVVKRLLRRSGRGGRAQLSRAEQEELRDFLLEHGKVHPDNGTLRDEFGGRLSLHLGYFDIGSPGGMHEGYVVWNPGSTLPNQRSNEFGIHMTAPDPRDVSRARDKVQRKAYGEPTDEARETLGIFDIRVWTDETPTGAPALPSPAPSIPQGILDEIKTLSDERFWNMNRIHDSRRRRPWEDTRTSTPYLRLLEIEKRLDELRTAGYSEEIAKLDPETAIDAGTTPHSTIGMARNNMGPLLLRFKEARGADAPISMIPEYQDLYWGARKWNVELTPTDTADSALAKLEGDSDYRVRMEDIEELKGEGDLESQLRNLEDEISYWNQMEQGGTEGNKNRAHVQAIRQVIERVTRQRSREYRRLIEQNLPKPISAQRRQPPSLGPGEGMALEEVGLPNLRTVPIDGIGDLPRAESQALIDQLLARADRVGLDFLIEELRVPQHGSGRYWTKAIIKQDLKSMGAQYPPRTMRVDTIRDALTRISNLIGEPQAGRIMVREVAEGARGGTIMPETVPSVDLESAVNLTHMEIPTDPNTGLIEIGRPGSVGRTLRNQWPNKKPDPTEWERGIWGMDPDNYSIEGGDWERYANPGTGMIGLRNALMIQASKIADLPLTRVNRDLLIRTVRRVLEVQEAFAGTSAVPFTKSSILTNITRRNPLDRRPIPPGDYSAAKKLQLERLLSDPEVLDVVYVGRRQTGEPYPSGGREVWEEEDPMRGVRDRDTMTNEEKNEELSVIREARELAFDRGEDFSQLQEINLRRGRLSEIELRDLAKGIVDGEVPTDLQSRVTAWGQVKEAEEAVRLRKIEIESELVEDTERATRLANAQAAQARGLLGWVPPTQGRYNPHSPTHRNRGSGTPGRWVVNEEGSRLPDDAPLSPDDEQYLQELEILEGSNLWNDKRALDLANLRRRSGQSEEADITISGSGTDDDPFVVELEEPLATRESLDNQEWTHVGDGLIQSEDGRVFTQEQKDTAEGIAAANDTYSDISGDLTRGDRNFVVEITTTEGMMDEMTALQNKAIESKNAVYERMPRTMTDQPDFENLSAADGAELHKYELIDQATAHVNSNLNMINANPDKYKHLIGPTRDRMDLVKKLDAGEIDNDQFVAGINKANRDENDLGFRTDMDYNDPSGEGSGKRGGGGPKDPDNPLTDSSRGGTPDGPNGIWAEDGEVDDIWRRVVDHRVAREPISTTLLRLHEAKLTHMERAATIMVADGSKMLQKAGIGQWHRGHLVPRPGTNDLERLDKLYDALHNPSLVESGDIVVEEALRETYDLVRWLTNFEEAARVRFDPEMSKIMDYMYRGWKAPKNASVFNGEGELVWNPSFRKPRRDATFREMRNDGWQPMYWNPFEQWKLSRYQGIKYRQQMMLVEVMKSEEAGLARKVLHGNKDPNMRVPEVGPAFEGKPYVNNQGDQAKTAQHEVDKSTAKILEAMYGRKPTRWPGEDKIKLRHIQKIVDWLVFIPKQVALFGSFFQHLDFILRNGKSAFTRMVTDIERGTGTIGKAITGQPGGDLRKGIMEIAKSPVAVGVWPKNVLEVIITGYSRDWRTNIMRVMDDKTPLIPGRPDINMYNISRAGLAWKDTTLFKADMDNEIAEIWAESDFKRRALSPLRAIQKFDFNSRQALFEGVYPTAIVTDIQRYMARSIYDQYSHLSDAKINSMIAMTANKAYSVIPPTQSVVKSRFFRALLSRLTFSFSENEGLLRQGLDALMPMGGDTSTPLLDSLAKLDDEQYGAFKRKVGRFAKGVDYPTTGSYARRQWLGAVLFLGLVANVIHFASTTKVTDLLKGEINDDTWGELLPWERYLPVGFSDWSPIGIGYNSQFMSPNLWKGKTGLQMTLDTMMQLDTVFRILDPPGFLEGRLSIPARVAVEQWKGEDFYGQPMDTWAKRAGGLARTGIVPIGIGEGLLNVATEHVPGLDKVFTPGESPDVALNVAQSAGLNVRQHNFSTEADRQSMYMWGTTYKQMESYKQDVVKSSPEIKSVIVREGTKVAGDLAAKQDRLNRLEDIAKDPDPDRAVRAYLIEEAFTRGVREGRDLEGDWDEYDFSKDLEHSNPNRRAVSEYYSYLDNPEYEEATSQQQRVAIKDKIHRQYAWYPGKNIGGLPREQREIIEGQREAIKRALYRKPMPRALLQQLGSFATPMIESQRLRISHLREQLTERGLPKAEIDEIVNRYNRWWYNEEEAQDAPQDVPTVTEEAMNAQMQADRWQKGIMPRQKTPWNPEGLTGIDPETGQRIQQPGLGYDPASLIGGKPIYPMDMGPAFGPHDSSPPIYQEPYFYEPSTQYPGQYQWYGEGGISGGPGGRRPSTFAPTPYPTLGYSGTQLNPGPDAFKQYRINPPLPRNFRDLQPTP